MSTDIWRDAIVIPRTDLPEVKRDESGGLLVGTTRWPEATARKMTAATFRESGLESLALAEYLDAHPPMDEAQATALGMALAKAAETDGGCLDGWNFPALGTALARLGVRVVEVRP